MNFFENAFQKMEKLRSSFSCPRQQISHRILITFPLYVNQMSFFYVLYFVMWLVMQQDFFFFFYLFTFA